jgi:hypothetical protein
MKTPVPLQFLVGITRLIPIYFGLRSMESLGSLMMTHGILTSASPEIGAKFPSVWSLYLPTLLVYLALVIATWFLAPAICRLALRTGPEEPVEATAEGDLNWGEIMIFLTGILLAGWGMCRIGDWLVPILQASSRTPLPDLNIRNGIGLFVGFPLLGAGVLLAVRFAKVYRWCQKRKATSTRPN